MVNCQTCASLHSRRKSLQPLYRRKTTNYKVQVGKPIEQTEMNCSRNVAIKINSAHGILSARRWRQQAKRESNRQLYSW